MEKLIITAALIGSAPTREQNPHLPYTPQEIAEEALRSWRAGASVVHVHVRDPKTGKPAFAKELFAEVLDRIRSESDLLVNLTTSSFSLTGPDVNEKRLMPLGLKPDLCSLDVGSCNFRGGVFINPAEWGDLAAKRMREAGIKPEVEVFDLGHLIQAKDMVKRGLFAPPPWFQICLGVQWGAAADLETLMAFVSRLPEGAKWSVLGVGPRQLPLTTHAMLLGGHVRVGFEDNLYFAKGVKAKSNAEFVERAAALARLVQRDVASCAEARAILGLPPRG